MKKTLVAGHVCLDITPIFPATSGQNLLEPGKLVAVGEADIHTGGAVANTGLAMHFFGADVELLSKVGDDSFGELVKKALNSSGAPCRIKTDKSGNTSYSVVIAQPNIDRIFLHCSGVNDTFCCDDVTDADLEGISLFHFGYPTLMKNLYANRGEQLVRLFKKVSEKGIVTSLDLAAVDPQSEAGRVDWEQILTDTLPYVDLFVPSFEELLFMLDRERYDSLSGKGDMCLNISVDDASKLAERAISMGASAVLIKCGAAGMYFASGNNARFTMLLELKQDEWLNKRGFCRSFLPRKVVSGTGAGDSSIAAFLTATLRGYSFEHSVNLAAAAGATCVEAYDAISGLKSFDELEKRISGGWQRQNLIKIKQE